MRIQLNDAEMRLAKHIAIERTKHNQSHNYSNKNQSGRNDLTIGTQGIEGEIAVCKHFNLYPDLVTDKPEKHDIVIYGHTFDIKTTEKSHFLNVAHWKSNNPCDFYALVIKDKNNFTLAGHVSKEGLFDAQNLKQGERGLYWRIHKSKLTPFKGDL